MRPRGRTQRRAAPAESPQRCGGQGGFPAGEGEQARDPANVERVLPVVPGRSSVGAAQRARIRPNVLSGRAAQLKRHRTARVAIHARADESDGLANWKRPVRDENPPRLPCGDPVRLVRRRLGNLPVAPRKRIRKRIIGAGNADDGECKGRRQNPFHGKRRSQRKRRAHKPPVEREEKPEVGLVEAPHATQAPNRNQRRRPPRRMARSTRPKAKVPYVIHANQPA